MRWVGGWVEDATYLDRTVPGGGDEGGFIHQIPIDRGDLRLVFVPVGDGKFVCCHEIPELEGAVG